MLEQSPRTRRRRTQSRMWTQGVPTVVQWKWIRLGSMGTRVPSLASLRELRTGHSIAMSCGVGHRCSSDPTLLWLGRQLAAVALIQPLDWELLYAASAALKSKKRKKPKKKTHILSRHAAWITYPYFYLNITCRSLHAGHMRPNLVGTKISEKSLILSQPEEYFSLVDTIFVNSESPMG